MSAPGAVLLAAGESRRYGPDNKLLADIAGEALLRRTAKTILDSGVVRLIVVSGAYAQDCAQALSGLPLQIIQNAQWALGIGSSISAGIQALGPDVSGAMIVPADMPLLTSPCLRSLQQVFAEHSARRIVYPTPPNGEQRNPVLWPQRFFGALAALNGAQGAKPLLKAAQADALAVPFDDDTLFVDIDTPEDFTPEYRALLFPYRTPS